jgi:hypothetical protein
LIEKGEVLYMNDYIEEISINIISIKIFIAQPAALVKGEMRIDERCVDRWAVKMGFPEIAYREG